MPWNPNSQRAYLTKLWNAMSQEEQQQIPLETFIEMGSKNQESQEPLTGDFGQYHVESSPLELVGGGIPGSRIASISNFWLGPEHPLTFKDKNSMMGVYTKDPIEGGQVNFRREVSPYMMYTNPEDPTMWDEMPDPNDPGIFKGRTDWYDASQQVRKVWNKDREEDTARQSFKNELRHKNQGLYIQLSQAGTLEQMIDSMMKQMSGG